MVISDAEHASIALHPVRLQILETLGEPASPAALSRKLGIPRQHLNYHVKELERAGLVTLVEEKRRGSATERTYRATARSYVIGPTALGEMRADPAAIDDRHSAEFLLAIGSRLIEDVAKLGQEGPIRASMAIETMIGFASDADRSAFARELTAAVSRLAATYHKEEGEKFRLVVAAHPTLAG